jgi:predicted permease
MEIDIRRDDNKRPTESTTCGHLQYMSLPVAIINTHYYQQAGCAQARVVASVQITTLYSSFMKAAITLLVIRE